MKRSKPLRRTLLKRTRMKRTRKTPRHQNPELRREYREANPECEWGYHFPTLHYSIGSPVDMRRVMAPEVNHIWSRSHGDDWSGLITLSKYAHDWFHANLTAGRILCMLVKCEKGESDIEFWSKASGKRIVSWVESLGVYYPTGDWMRPYWQRLMDELQNTFGYGVYDE